jgi:hypothetical protein
MNKIEKTLDELMAVQFATINNFYSRKAKTVNGALLQSTRIFDELLRLGLITPIESNFKTSNTRQTVFYSPTLDGARYLYREDEYRKKRHKPYNLLYHESAKIDVALSFLRLFPDHIVEIIYNAKIDLKIVDILIILTHKTSGNKYFYMVEIERKDFLSGAVCLFNPEVAAKMNPKDNKYNIDFERVRLLIIYLPRSANPFLRPQDAEFEVRRAETQTLINYHLKKAHGSPFAPWEMVMNFYNFHKLNKAVWYNSKGEKCQLIY